MHTDGGVAFWGNLGSAIICQCLLVNTVSFWQILNEIVGGKWSAFSSKGWKLHHHLRL